MAKKTILVHNKNNIYTYGRLMKDFVEYIKVNDFSRLRDVIEPFRFEHIEGRIGYKKRLMKTRLSQSYVNKPILSVNGSIYTDEDGTDMYPGDFFNMESVSMFNFSPEQYGDCCIKGGEDKIKKDAIKFIAVPRRAKMNIEMTIVHDFSQQLENLRQMWNVIRYRDHKYEAKFVIKNIVSINTALNLAYALGLFKTSEELKVLSYKDIFLFLRQFTMPGFLLTYEFDGSTNRYEIMMGYENTALLRSEVIMVEKGNVSGSVERDAYLMRQFFVEFNIVNMFYIIVDKHIDFQGAEKVLTFDTEESKYLGENLNKLFETANGLPLNPPPHVPRFTDNMTSVMETTYTSNGIDDCNIYEIIDSEIMEFLSKLKLNQIDIKLYFKVRVYDYLSMEELDIDVDYDKLKIYKDDIFTGKKYHIRLFLDLLEYQRFKQNIEGYEKLK